MPRPVSPPDPRPPGGTIPADSAQFPRIAGYRFQKRLGEGGMATVYLATQESLDRPVAIKVMEREALADEVSMQRFENEARTIAQLTHPSIVNIYEVGRTFDGRMYYIMPYLANGDLSQRDMRGKEDRIIEVLRTLLSALEYAHARGIVHRDVKEANVLFDVADRPLLTDFGIALSRRDMSRITSAGHAVGSSGYMAPEQARGDIVDGRADLYSVGVLAFELLTGRLPFRSPDSLALALMHAQNPVPRLPPAKRHWQAFIDRAMEKSPDHRYRDATHMIEALDKVGSRTSGRFFGRVLRGYDKTVDGKVWKHPGTIALFGAMLVVFGLYSARDQLPFGGGTAAAANAPDAAATVSGDAAPTPAAAQVPAAPGKPSPVALPAPQAATTSVAATPSSPAAVVDPAAAGNGSPDPAAKAAAAPPASAPVSPAATVPAPPANAGSATAASTSIGPDAAVIGQARFAIAHGNLIAPADDNAVDLTVMAWKLSPATNDTKALASDTLKALAEQQALAIVQHKDARISDLQLKQGLLADATIGRTTPAWKALHATQSTAIEKRTEAESLASDDAALKRTAALAKQLDLADAYAHGITDAQQHAGDAAKAAAALANDLGPGFMLLPPPTVKSRSAKPVPSAIARAEVTRHEYALFVNATRRPASACGDPKTQATTGDRKNWSEPGFPQTSDSPVVCVSWNDANAYVQWLSAQKGQHYRLASTADWHSVASNGAASAPGQPGISGSYSEWLQDCASGCQSHVVVAHGSAGTGREAAQGFDDVGIRVVRVLDAHH